MLCPLLSSGKRKVDSKEAKKKKEKQDAQVEGGHTGVVYHEDK